MIINGEKAIMLYSKVLFCWRDVGKPHRTSAVIAYIQTRYFLPGSVRLPIWSSACTWRM